jgi:hypothetical protein
MIRLVILVLIFIVVAYHLKYSEQTYLNFYHFNITDEDLRERSRDLYYYKTYGNYCPELLPANAVSSYMLEKIPAGNA